MATKPGHGAAVTISGITLREITDISWSGISRNAVETTNMATGAETSSLGGRSSGAASPTDAGEVTVEANLDTNAASDGWITAIDADASDVVLTFPDSSGTWTANGFVTNLSYSVPLEDKMSASITVKLTGNIVVA